jgi:beta-N-acetylhexosaminidase
VKQYLLATIFVVITSQTNPINISIHNLTLDQKIGQLFMVTAVADEEVAKDFISQKSYRMDKEYITELITQYHIGGIIYLGKSDIKKQIERTHYFQSISAIPLLVGQDLEPGRVGVSRLQAMQKFSNNQTLGNKNSTEETYQTACEIGKLCKQLGVHINFAPVADVNNNPNNPVINDRSFGDDPELVTQHAIACAQGLRGAGIIACAKHFPGHGDTNVDSHENLPIIMHDAQRLHAIELYPFKKLIAENIPAIMIGHLEIPAFEEQPKLPSSLSKKIVTDLLQKELGFAGLIITDGLDMHGITKYYTNGNAELQALLAGNDILLCPVDVPAAIAVIKEAVADNLITEEKIDVHVQKILDIKNMFNTQSHL